MTDTDRVEMLMAGEKPVEKPLVEQASTPVVEKILAPQVVVPKTVAVIGGSAAASAAIKVAMIAPKVSVMSPTVAPVSLTSAVNASNAKKLTVPKGLSLFNTKELSGGFFHGCVYSETSARKSSTAAQFGSAADVRIILTRRKEQLIPLRDLGYEAALVENADSLMFALQYPEQLWPDWATRKDRTLVLDDATEAVAMLLEDAGTIDGKEVKDARRSYKEAGDNLRESIRSILRKPMHFVMVALAKVRENALTNEERIGPDLPPSMLNMLLTELEFVFYINPRNWKFQTERDRIAVKDIDPQTNKEKTFIREIFAKHKLPLGLVGKGIIKPNEDMDLQSIWKRVNAAQGTVGK